MSAKGTKALHGEKSCDTVLLTLSSLHSTVLRRSVSNNPIIGFRLKVFLAAVKGISFGWRFVLAIFFFHDACTCVVEYLILTVLFFFFYLV